MSSFRRILTGCNWETSISSILYISLHLPESFAPVIQGFSVMRWLLLPLRLNIGLLLDVQLSRSLTAVPASRNEFSPMQWHLCSAPAFCSKIVFYAFSGQNKGCGIVIRSSTVIFIIRTAVGYYHRHVIWNVKGGDTQVVDLAPVTNP